MTALTPRQAIKVKAALSLIAVHGHNPRTVQQAATAELAKGYPANIAYKNAIDGFIARVPAMGNTLHLAVDLIHNSDEATVALYDKVLTDYNNSGDESHLDSLAPMILEDAKALAISKGEVTEADAANWTIDDALGSTSEAYAATPDVPDATTLAPGQTANSSFAFNGLPSPAAQAPAAPAPVASTSPRGAGPQPPQAPATGPQWVMGPTGYTLVNQAPSGPQAGRSMTGYDPHRGGQDATGIRVAQTGEAARRSHGTPVGDLGYMQTATGIRIAPTGEAARREAGVPLGYDA
ncbi:hypothetical protein SAMN05192583_1915 [Sphingomonas gellani]|uniref:Uncharacterized protein n=1 Tax=Sphingomonas gellani TaxID=1166340 RepID=A0A1H8DI71_9SPHN|nr:hypothetical protein [Sphingomonas gellani]SEN06227.1 hypothetical protein SAMN05192583_1915 [Sphingomonas gellani]